MWVQKRMTEKVFQKENLLFLRKKSGVETRLDTFGSYMSCQQIEQKASLNIFTFCLEECYPLFLTKFNLSFIWNLSHHLRRRLCICFSADCIFLLNPLKSVFFQEKEVLLIFLLYFIRKSYLFLYIAVRSIKRSVT